MRARLRLLSFCIIALRGFAWRCGVLRHSSAAHPSRIVLSAASKIGGRIER